MYEHLPYDEIVCGDPENEVVPSMAHPVIEEVGKVSYFMLLVAPTPIYLSSSSSLILQTS